MDDDDLTKQMCPTCGEALFFAVQPGADETHDESFDPDIRVTPKLGSVQFCRACGWTRPE